MDLFVNKSNIFYESEKNLPSVIKTLRIHGYGLIADAIEESYEDISDIYYKNTIKYTELKGLHGLG